MGSGSGRAKPLPFRFGRFGEVGLSQLSVRIAARARSGGGCGARSEIHDAVVRASPVEMCGKAVGICGRTDRDGASLGGMTVWSGVAVCATIGTSLSAAIPGAAGISAASHFVRPIMRIRAHANGRGFAVPLARRSQASSGGACVIQTPAALADADNFAAPSPRRDRPEFRRSRRQERETPHPVCCRRASSNAREFARADHRRHHRGRCRSCFRRRRMPVRARRARADVLASAADREVWSAWRICSLTLASWRSGPNHRWRKPL